MNANIYTIKLLPNYNGFHDFIRHYRDLYKIPLIKIPEDRKYHNITIQHVLAINSEESILSLPQRLILNSFINDSPIVSYGCICSCIKNGEINFLLVKRRDSVSYIDFLLGNYRISQLFLLIRDLCHEERERLLTHDFDALWRDFKAYTRDKESKESDKSKKKENTEETEKKEEIVTNSGNYEYAKIQFLYLAPRLRELFEKVPSADPSGKGMWGFPKGKPTVLNPEVLGTKIETNTIKYESALNCAFREFKEETNGIALENYEILLPDPISELYTGTNNKNYQTHYFAVQLINSDAEIKQFETHNTGIRNVVNNESAIIKWVPVSEINNYLRDHRVKLCEYIIAKQEKNENFNEIWKNSVVIADEFTPTYD